MAVGSQLSFCGICVVRLSPKTGEGRSNVIPVAPVAIIVDGSRIPTITRIKRHILTPLTIGVAINVGTCPISSSVTSTGISTGVIGEPIRMAQIIADSGIAGHDLGVASGTFECSAKITVRSC